MLDTGKCPNYCVQHCSCYDQDLEKREVEDTKTVRTTVLDIKFWTVSKELSNLLRPALYSYRKLLTIFTLVLGPGLD